MAFGFEFPHTSNFDSDLRQIIEMYNSVKNLPSEWNEFKLEMTSTIENFLTNYLDTNIEELLNRFILDTIYESESETIRFYKKDEV